MSKRSYERRIRAKREAQRAARKRAERMRKLRIAGSIVAGLAIAVTLLIVFLPGGKPIKPSANPSTSASPTPTASPIAGCTYPTPAPRPNGKKYTKAPAMTIDTKKVYVATLQTTCGTIKLNLDAVKAPRSTNNFVFLARQHYFDNTNIPRVQNDATFGIVQAGSQTGTISGGVDYSYQGETPAPGSRYTKGVVAMANSGGPSTNGSQFFFVVSATAPALDQNPNYSIFGKVDDATSLAALDRIKSAGGSEIEGGGLGITPNPPIYILKVTIEELKRG